MKRAYFIIFIVLFFYIRVSSQITITGNSNLCLGETTTLTALTSGASYGTTNYIFEIIDYTSHPDFSGGTVVDPDFVSCNVPHDDCFAPGNSGFGTNGYPIGFTFCFFNQQYDRFWVGSNGWIGFTNPTGHSWTTYTATPIPNTASDVPKNCIFAPWQDWFPGAQGAFNSVYYYTIGTAPNRRLVVYWINCPLWACQSETANRGTFMIVLNEQSSIIENFIQLKPQCTSSNEGATQGVINLVGDVAYTATGRNYGVWTAANEGTRFTPSGITWYKDAYPGGTKVGYGEELTVTPTVTTTYFAVVGNCDGTNASGSIIVTVNPRPTPTFISGAAVACQNDVKTYTTETTGNSYTWGYSGTWIAGGGSADNSVTLKWSTTGLNFVSVNYKNAFSCEAVIPTTLSVNVNPFETPVITTIADQFCAETQVTFTTQPGKSSYTWVYLPSGATLISGGTSVDNTIVLKWSTPGLKTVTVNYTDAGCTGDPPTSKQVTIKPLPVVNEPLTKNICSGDNTSIMLSSSPVGANFAWNVPVPSCSANIFSCPAGVASGTTISDVLSLTDNNPGTVTYHIIPTLNGCTGNTQNYVVNVNPLPTVNTIANQVLCHNAQSALIQFSGNVPGTIYNWTNTNTSIGLATNGTGDILSFQAINATNAPITATITVIPAYTNSGATCTGTSTLFTITVNPIPMVNPVTNQVLCHQASTGSVILSGNVPGTVYSWVNSTTSIGLAASGSGDISSFMATNSTTAPVTATISLTPTFTNSGTTCTGITSPFTITVNPVPTVNTLTNQVLCNQAFTASVTFSGNVPGTIYNWTNTNTSIGLAANGTGDILSFQATNATSAPITATITVTPAYTNSGITCTGISTFFTITVNPIPMVNPVTNQVLCHQASTASVILSGTIPGTVYSWVNSTTSIGLAASGTGNIASFQASNTTNAQVVATIVVTPTYTNAGGTCSGTPISFTITVNPLPIPTISGPGANCLNLSSTYTTEDLQFNYLWNVVSGGIITSGQFTKQIDVLWNTLGTHTITVNYIDQHGCTSVLPTSKQVVINSIPIPTLTGDAIVCAGQTKTYQTQTGAQSYSWGLPSSGITIVSGGSLHDDQVTIKWDVANVYNISVNYIISTGCTAQNPTNISVTVNAQPTPQITGPTPVCGLTMQSYSLTPIVSGHLYTWSVTGGTIQSGQNASVVQVFWGNSISGSLDLNETINYSGISCSASAVTYPIVLNPWPDAAGNIIGQNSVCKTSTITYSIPSILNAVSYQWLYTGTGITIVNNGNSTISITFSSTATNGTLSVRGVNNCGDGTVSPPLNIAVHNLPEVSFIPCFDLITTSGAKKIILRGGTPYLSGQGVYSGNRVSLNASSGVYEFDPFGATPGNYSITYTFTNTFGCLAAVANVSISVQNNPFSCGGDMTDVRDGKKYKTAPLAGHCWMTQNLNYGTGLVSAPVPPQSDNCVAEKYCTPTDVSCSAYGGLYQWDELMGYAIAPGAKGLCPPEWHVPSETEWQHLIDNLVIGITAPDANATVAPDLTDPFIFNGFHGLLGGLNYLDNSWAFYTGANTATMYWTSTIDGTDHAVARGLNVFTPSISKYISSRANAFSVRCVKD